MINIVDNALLMHPTVDPTLFGDDLSGEQDGVEDVIISELGGFTEHVIRRIHADGMEVSDTKSLVSASNGRLAEALMKRLEKIGVKQSIRVKSLGGHEGSPQKVPAEAASVPSPPESRRRHSSSGAYRGGSGTDVRQCELGSCANHAGELEEGHHGGWCSEGRPRRAGNGGATHGHGRV